MQNANLVNTGASAGGTSDAFAVFDSWIDTNAGFGLNHTGVSTVGTPISATTAIDVAASHSASTPVPRFDTALGLAPGALQQSELVSALGAVTTFSPGGQNSHLPADVTTTWLSTYFSARRTAWSAARATGNSVLDDLNLGESSASDSVGVDEFIMSAPLRGRVHDALWTSWPANRCSGRCSAGTETPATGKGERRRAAFGPVIEDPLQQRHRSLPQVDYAATLGVLSLAAGFWVRGTGIIDSRSAPCVL